MFGPGAVRPRDFGRDDDVFAGHLEITQRLTEDLLREAFRIHVGGVDEIDARRERPLDQGIGVVLIDLAYVLPPRALAAERHGAQADFRNIKAGPAQRTMLHRCTPFFDCRPLKAWRIEVFMADGVVWMRSSSLWTRSPAVTQDFIDHLRGSLEMILQQIGRGDGVALDRGFKNQPVFRPDVSWDVRHRDGEAAIPVGAGVELAAESEQHLGLTCRDQRFMKGLVARLPFFVDGGR